MNTYRSVLVCVTQQRSCERLIRAGARLKSEDGTLYVIHVTKENLNFVDNANGEALEYLFNLTKSYGADLTVLNSDKIPETISQFAQHYGIEAVITGEGPNGMESPFIQRLKSLLNDTDTQVLVIPTEG